MFLAFAACGLARAEKADHDKPMNIEADSLFYDDLKQVSIFTGHAVLTKGTMVMRGERIEVTEDPDGYQLGTAFAGNDTRAFFRQKREGIDEYLEGEGKRIEYDGRADRVTLVDQAEVRRLRVTTLADQFFGKRIVYHNLTDVFTVDGQSAADGKPSGGRVKATLVPRSTANDKDKKP
jgi:lipopolysaccharide export system protein LptA